MDLKKGDKVLFVSKPYDTLDYGWIDDLNKWLGKVLTIKKIYKDHYTICSVYETYDEFYMTDFAKKIEIGE